MNIYEAYIGCLLQKPELYYEHAIEPQEMCSEYHHLFSKILDKILIGQAFDIVTLAKEFGKEAWFCGNHKLSQLLNVPSVHMISNYAKSIKQQHKKQQIAKILNNYNSLLDSEEPETIIAKIETEIFKFIDDSNHLPYRHISTIIKENKDLELKSISLDVPMVDEKWFLHKGGLHIIAARPNVGKTSFSVWLACRLLFTGHKVLFFSAETSELEMLNKFNKLMAQDLSNKDLYLNCTGGMSIENIITASKLLKSTKGLDVIFVDYIQLIGTKEKFHSREQYVAYISRTLKALSLNLNVPVIACAQLNRLVDSTSEKRPVLSNLRESGSIEQDSDSVLFLHRPDYYASMLNKELDVGQEGLVELLIAKQRNRATANLQCKWDKDNNIWSEFNILQATKPVKKIWANELMSKSFGNSHANRD